MQGLTLVGGHLLYSLLFIDINQFFSNNFHLPKFNPGQSRIMSLLARGRCVDSLNSDIDYILSAPNLGAVTRRICLPSHSGIASQ